MSKHDINYYLTANNNTLCPADISLGDIASSEWWQFVKPLWDDMLWLYYGDRVVFFNKRFPDDDDATSINNILRSWVILLKSKAHNYERLYNLYMQDYNPLWNVDGVIGTVAQDDHTGTDTRKKTGADTLRQQGTDTRAASGTDSTDILTSDDLIKSGNETMQASGDDINTKQVATFDSNDNFVNSEKDTVTNGKLDTHTYNNVTDARDISSSHDTTYGRTDTNTKNLTDTQEYNTTDQDTRNLTDKHVDLVIRQGNVGVTMSQQMWSEEAKLWSDQMSEFAKQIIREAVNLVTYAVEGI
jgi:hypothetical protein